MNKINWYELTEEEQNKLIEIHSLRTIKRLQRTELLANTKIVKPIIGIEVTNGTKRTIIIKPSHRVIVGLIYNEKKYTN